MECKFGCFSSLVAFLLRVYPLWWFDSMDQVAVTRPERLVCVFACLALLWVWHRFPPIRVHPFGCGPHPHPFHRISLLEGMAGNVVMHWFGLGFFLSFFRSLSPLRRHPLDPPSRRDGGKTPSLAPVHGMGWDGLLHHAHPGGMDPHPRFPTQTNPMWFPFETESNPEKGKEKMADVPVHSVGTSPAAFTA